MTGLLRKPLAWALALLLAAGVGFAVWRGRTPPGPAPTEAVVATSPFAAAANGKVDVEGGMIQVAARRAVAEEERARWLLALVHLAIEGHALPVR